MPKPVDEDRARRKQLLEQKKAARKAAAAKESSNERQEEEEKSNNKDQTKNDRNDNKTREAENPLLSLPVDALHSIVSMLSAADVGRFLLAGQRCVTSSAMHTFYLQRRCGPMLLPSSTEARYLLNDAFTPDDPEHLPKRPSQQQQQQVLLHETHIFLLLARFLEESLAGSALSSSSLLTYSPGRVVSISPEHSLVRLSNGTVVSWGVGKRGQLGHGVRHDERIPRLIARTAQHHRIVQIAAGGGLVRVAHSLLLTSTGRVLSFGTGQYGALGHGYSAAKQLPDCLQPTWIQALSQPCVCVAAGELHSAAVTVDGDVYTWGDGFCGQLGHGDKRPVTTPKQVLGHLAEECVATISCGSRHTLAITEDGECFSWGLGHFGVLGRSFTPFEYDADAAVRTFSPTVVGNEAVMDQAIPLPPERDMAAELAAHLDLIANLTLDDGSDQCIPKVIDALPGIRLIGASAGHRHSLLLDTHGSLYSFGAGSSGCLGHGTTESHMYPCRIVVPQNDDTGAPVVFRRMSAGVDMSMAVSTAGDVYGWGKTDGGRIGLGLTKSLITSPRRVYLGEVLDSPDTPLFKAVDVECGYVHSIILALNGTLWQCGGVGVEGENDGQQIERDVTIDKADLTNNEMDGRPRRIPQLKVWKSMPEPQKEVVKKERWQKLGKYEVRGRSQMK